MKTIATLVDFSDVTNKVIQQTETMAKALSARAVLLHFVPKEPVVIDLGIVSPTVTTAPSDEKKESDYEKLLDLRDALGKSGVDVVVHQLEDGKAESILKQCDELKADMVIVGAHHHSGLYQWLVGTCTTQVLHRARCPVLVVPAD